MGTVSIFTILVFKVGKLVRITEAVGEVWLVVIMNHMWDF